MSLLGPIGTCSYTVNGVTADLNPAETETTGFSVKPVYDTAGRTVIYSEIEIAIRTTIYRTTVGAVDAVVDALQTLLNQNGGAFIWQAKGGGTIRANVPGERSRDVNYGPKPQLLSLSKIHQLKTQIDFRITVCLPMGCTTPFFKGGVLEFNFRLAWAGDLSGRTRRTYSGHLVIPVTRGDNGSRKLQDNADLYLEKIVPKVPYGFERETNERTLNEAKNRLDFTIVDMEMGSGINFPPPGVIRIQASNELSGQFPGGVKYQGTLSANYELEKGTDPKVAKDHFFMMFNDRQEAIKKFIADNRKNPNGPGLDGKTGLNVIPMAFTATEPDIFGPPQCHFRLSYYFVSPISVFLTQSLYRPVPGSNWELWSQSLSAHAPHARGLAKLGFSNDDDLIIDPCYKPAVAPPMQSTVSSHPPLSRDQGFFGRTSLRLNNPPPGPGLGDSGNTNFWRYAGSLLILQSIGAEVSFIDYRSNVMIQTIDSVVCQTPLAKKKISTPSGSEGVQGDFSEANGVQLTDMDDQPKTLIQETSNGETYIVLTGKAMRVGYEVNPPKLVSVGGVKCIPANREQDGFAQEIIGNVGLPVYLAQWSIRYLLPHNPKRLDSPPSPFNYTARGGIVIDDTQVASRSGSPGSMSGSVSANFQDGGG